MHDEFVDVVVCVAVLLLLIGTSTSDGLAVTPKSLNCCSVVLLMIFTAVSFAEPKM